jgi:uncharacterized membrane protein
MPTDWESHLQRWTSAGAVDAAAAEQVRRWEAGQRRSRVSRSPLMLALVFGAIILAGAAIAFGSKHWDKFDDLQRMALTMAMVLVFHLGGAAVSSRFGGLSMALHTIGTLALGAAIALMGADFALSEYWPDEVLLWAIGAAFAWILLRHWTQAALVAILVPYWLAGEWWVRTIEARANDLLPVAAGLAALSLAYLGARHKSTDSRELKALAWLGGIALLPAIFVAPLAWHPLGLSRGLQVIAWSVAALLPLAVSIALRGRGAVWSCAAIVWALLSARLAGGESNHILWFGWCIVGFIALALWGSRESRPERIDLAIAGYVITLASFYFSSEMARLGRSIGLLAIGVLLLGGGWFLIRTRRRLVSGIGPGTV